MERYKPQGTMRVGHSPGDVAAEWLCLAASPVFLIMAGLVLAQPSGMQMPMPGAGSGLSLDGMALSYLLMGVFHGAPWLRLLSRGRTPKTQRRE